MKLWLCEKPSQAKDIAGALGIRSRGDGQIQTAQGVVTWCFGHLLEAAQPHEYDPRWKPWSLESLPIIPAEWKLVVKKEATHQVRVIQQLLKSASSVVIATDADREGEMIARELLDYCGYQGSVQRLWLGALDADSIRKALAKLRPGTATESLHHAAVARSRADWLAGMNLTRAATVLARSSGVDGGLLSVGRVQTPTLRLVVQRDREIEGFQSRDFYELVADVATAAGVLQLRHAPPEAVRIWDKAEADRRAVLANGARGPLQVSTERKREAPPRLFSLSLLQKACSKRFGWSAAKTLKVAQALYEEHKLISYPRTDCTCLPVEQQADIPRILLNLGALPEFKDVVGSLTHPVLRGSVWNNGAITAHHAIIPTTQPAALDRLRPDERQAYLLIARHYLAALMPDAEVDVTTVSMDANGIALRTAAKTLKVPGWRAVLEVQPDAKGEQQVQSLPSIPDGIEGTVRKVAIETRATTPPDRYTEGTLIDDMKSIAKFAVDPGIKARLKETSGIGTEATRAEVIETLKDRDYVRAKGRHLLSTERGRALIDALPPQISDPALTGLWEDQLERVVTGSLTEPQFTAQAAQWVATMVRRMTEHGVQVPKAAAPGKQGKGGGAVANRSVESPKPPMRRAETARTSPPTPKMLQVARQTAERLQLELPDDVLKDFDACRTWLSNHLQSSSAAAEHPPSPKALAYAETLARRFQRELPADVARSAKACAGFIDHLRVAGAR